MSSLESCLSGLSLSVFLVIARQCEHHKATACVLTTLRLTCSEEQAAEESLTQDSPDTQTYTDNI